ncbi:ABC transporter permease [Acrocarpospora macrocephala]|uniref:Transport permease protein n=1 Tax=Acrocarpospora macrocephala TaxID=150177 RepID=A0A5M3WQ48_9ACTN|nr:ABC transporter permease [Acrocarpospora macrocephala]GES08833.1 transport permease protein [Acrocarpospora macrocephala]
MSTRSYAVTDSITMLRRDLKKILRYPTSVIFIVGFPLLFLLLFVYVFGGALGTSVANLGNGSTSYVDYIVPGLVVMTAATGSLGTSSSVNVDMTEGIIARFRTMAIFRPSILIARVVSSMMQTLTSMALIFGVALLMGFRPTAGIGEWIMAIGLLALATFALTWLGVAFGVAAKTLDAASNAPFPLIILPFVGSGIVPTESMPNGVRQFAEYQPFTPIIETLRGLLMGTPIGHNAVIAIAWCVGLSIVGFLWARKNFNRDRTQ